jgi:peroxiredoxin
MDGTHGLADFPRATDMRRTKTQMRSLRPKQDLSMRFRLRLKHYPFISQHSHFLARMLMVNQITVGDRAPDFTLPDANLKARGLKEFLGQKVVLAFFVGAFTTTCTKEMCEFRDSMARLIDLNAQVVGISVNDPFANKAFAEKNRLPFPILSDYNREVIKEYGLELADFAGLKGYIVAKRSIFILDKDGIVRYVWVSDNPTIEPNYGEIQKALEQIK